MQEAQRVYQVDVQSFRVDRNDLGVFGRIAAVATGQWPKVTLHKIECPCCGKINFHRAVKKGTKGE